MDLLLKRRRIIASQRAEDNTDYTLLPLTFKCLTGGDLSAKNENGTYDRNFEYSLNGGAWTTFNLPANTNSKLIATLSPGDTISFRRDNDNFYQARFLSDSNLTFDIYGNLLSLQYGSSFNGQTELRNTNKQAFGPIFQGTNVVDASKLMLTATTISNGCYQAMFWNCTYLTHAPEIEARTLVGNQGHFQRMFSGCSSLIKPPSILHVTSILENSCYEMFCDCSSLTYAPNMSAITNVSGISSCRTMFKNCISLITAPELNATTLGRYCYAYMFEGCTSLTVAPELPATILANNCYQSMFMNCINLVTAPELPATTLAQNCYADMFRNCTSLVNAPELPATTLANNCYYEMFWDCTSLITAPNLPATILVESCYYRMFYGCLNLENAPELPAQTLVKKCYMNMFLSCRKLNYIKCLATDISAEDCINVWASSVSGTGTFVKASGVTWPSGGSGIPNGWTVIEE